MDAGVVAEAVRAMKDEEIGQLMSELPAEALPAMVRGLGDTALFSLVSQLPDGSAAKQAVALVIGNTALRRAAETPVVEKRGRGRPRKVAEEAGDGADEGEAKSRRARAAKTSTRAPGEKRSPQELAQLTERTYLTIKANPGIRMEALAEALEVKSREISLPIKKLIADKKIKAAGHKRATEYTAR
jgi:hypothetical protein